ncbi:hypothetical protein EYF80_015304 [Liparis tanakae]|uniref:Uncharacterized protein n=1 Tax=Liparis tanakae TaxID=230148 RepID=A0A4Z2IB28_9TELE|nr:hypothetical protein EYF80_015304 [Liparis tanakae]
MERQDGRAGQSGDGHHLSPRLISPHLALAVLLATGLITATPRLPSCNTEAYHARAAYRLPVQKDLLATVRLHESIMTLELFGGTE